MNKFFEQMKFKNDSISTISKIINEENFEIVISSDKEENDEKNNENDDFVTDENVE